MADYGIKVTKPGKDVSSTDPRDFTIHSGYNTLKIFMEGYGSEEIEYDSGLHLVTVAHDLGYKPIVWAYAYDPTDSRWRQMNFQRTITGGFNAGWQHTDGTTSGGGYVDSNNDITLFLYYDGGEPATTQTVYYKYFIMIDPRKDAWYG